MAECKECVEFKEAPEIMKKVYGHYPDSDWYEMSEQQRKKYCTCPSDQKVRDGIGG